MHHDDAIARRVDVELDRVSTQIERPEKRRDRVLRAFARRAAVADQLRRATQLTVPPPEGPASHSRSLSSTFFSRIQSRLLEDVGEERSISRRWRDRRDVVLVLLALDRLAIDVERLAFPDADTPIELLAGNLELHFVGRNVLVEPLDEATDFLPVQLPCVLVELPLIRRLSVCPLIEASLQPPDVRPLR